MSLETSPNSAPGSPDCGDVSVIFVGKSGVGKSALLNAVREMTEDDAGSAPVGAPVKSEKPIMYPDPIYSNLLLWERSMDGKGHADQWMREADLIVLVTEDKFEDSHARLVLEARQAGKKVYFARSKADLELHTLKRLMGQRYNQSEVLQALREACTESLGTLPLVDPFVYLISAFEPGALDCPCLREDLLKDLHLYERLVGQPADRKVELLSKEGEYRCPRIMSMEILSHPGHGCPKDAFSRGNWTFLATEVFWIMGLYVRMFGIYWVKRYLLKRWLMGNVV